MTLQDLCRFDNIVIQCHDNPDADAIASGYALLLYFREKGKNVRFVYGGRFTISKSNLCLMTEIFEIPVEHITELDPPELLLTVDAQYAEGNITRFEAQNVAVIDHHQVLKPLPPMSIVRSNLGSCSTIVWDLLHEEHFDFTPYPNLETILYYGLLTDTNNFSEVSHPLDKDLRDDATFKQRYISLLKNCNLSMSDLKIAGEALEHSSCNEKFHCGVAETKPCDPNILGIISDMFLEVDTIDTGLVFSVQPFGVKLSVRSCVREVQACELAEYLTEGIGSGGGHLAKAGGFISRELLEKAGIEYDSANIRAFLENRMNRYFEETEVIIAGEYIPQLSEFSKYRKLRLHLGYVDPADLNLIGRTALVRTLDGDINVTFDDTSYLVIGIDGEIYPTSKVKFERNYEYSDEPYVFPSEYEPQVKDILEGTSLSITPSAKSCYSTGNGMIYARQLDRRTKVFTSWDEERYYLGKPGDYLASRCDCPEDVYIINRDIFLRSYEPADDN